ncbi:MAG: double-strand break repair protein AddB [Pseudomonadota bacterium]
MLFDDSTPRPRLFATPVGTDLCAALIAGLEARLADQPPEAWARIEIWVANGRMQRRLQALFAARGPSLMPRIRPVLSLADQGDLAGVPPAIPPLRLRLELADVIGRLLDRMPDLAPRSALYDLADSLADLMGEMFEEGVTPSDITALDVGDHAQHWQRAQAFLGVIGRYFDGDAPLTQEARQRQVVEAMIRDWDSAPPRHPVIVAGSTGSRGATARLITAVARLPQGAVVLPGLDRDMPRAIWSGVLEGRRAGLAGEDHPQYRLAKVAERLGLDPWHIRDWGGAPPGAQSRSKAVSLALRPAPVTDQWRAEGPKLEDLTEAFAPVTLVEAPSLQAEATAIALRLREAAEHGQRAALISPDRRLARQVTAALDRWGILPDDSAGQPLAQTTGGRFLRHIADLMTGPVDAEAMVAILKHPLCHSGAERGPHLLRTRDLELEVLRGGAAVPTRARLVDWAAERKDDPGAMAWVGWLSDVLMAGALPAPMALIDRVAAHLDRAEALARGPASDGAGRLYDGEDGAALARLVSELRAEAEAGGAMNALYYRDLFTALTEDREARQTLRPHADILIWGTQEARVQGADLMILAGLNEGTWPLAPAADPWLNRAMRAEAGLRLPDRVIGLSAHDFQQAVAAPEVWITRSVRDDETDTVPSRWLNRLTNLLRGSGEVAAQALQDMRARGAGYLAQAEALMTPAARLRPAPRPAPCPPVSARPEVLSVTQVEKLIRDPYAVYAARVLRLYPLTPLRPAPDAALRGTVLHAVMRGFVEETRAGLPDPVEAEALLMQWADRVLAEEAPWPTARRLWRARMARVAGHVVETEAERRTRGKPVAFEARATWDVPGTGVKLRGTADRIDALTGGGYAIYDYKTGAPPTEKQERAFNKQLWLEALMVEGGAFDLPPPWAVRHIAYLGLGATPKTVAHDPAAPEMARLFDQFRDRLIHMRAATSGFPSRRAMQGLSYGGDYDQLARYGEWDEKAEAVLIPVGDAE